MAGKNSEAPRLGSELANIFAIAYYEKVESAWTLMSSISFDELLNEHQLPRCRHQMGHGRHGTDWRVNSSAGITASFDAELTESSDDTPSLTGTTITVRKAQATAVVSVEAFADQPDISLELGMMFADAKNRLDETVI